MNHFKCITFSFDDGNIDDIRLVRILNKYGLKATFNLSAGQMTKAFNWRYMDKKDVYHFDFIEYPKLYDGHEIACHGYTHPHLEHLDENTINNEVKMDKSILHFLYGKTVRGMAYPYGTYNGTVIDILRENNIEYSRTVKSVYDFALPENFLEWHPTCHFKDNRLLELAEKFIKTDFPYDAVFYIWGHSYELVDEQDWQQFEEFCKYISNRKDIFYCTNIEIIDLIKGKEKRERF